MEVSKMKKVMLLIIATLWVAIAQAVVLEPGEERPIFAAKMKVEKADGYGQDVFDPKLTMTRQDGVGEDPTGFELTFISRESSKKEKLFFKISEKKEVECGSVEYIGYSNADAEFGMSNHEIILTDHSKRFCKDLKPYLWEARINLMSCVYMELLQLGGNPEPIFTPAIL